MFGLGALSREGLGEVVAAASLCCCGVSCCSLLSVVAPRFQFRQLAQGCLFAHATDNLISLRQCFLYVARMDLSPAGYRLAAALRRAGCPGGGEVAMQLAAACISAGRLHFGDGWRVRGLPFVRQVSPQSATWIRRDAMTYLA